MKLSKKIIQKEIILFLKAKNKKINFKINNTDLFEADLLDSIDFLNLISSIEEKYNIEIDVSQTNPLYFRKMNTLVNSFYKGIKN